MEKCFKQKLYGSEDKTIDLILSDIAKIKSQSQGHK